MKKCNKDSCNNPVWAKGVCKKHTPKIPIPRKGLYQQMRERPATDLKRTNEKIDKEAMRTVFRIIWKNRAHKSQLSPIYLSSELLSIYCHHILPKSKYPQAMLDEENIILLSGDEHTNVENDMYKYEEINRRRDYLKVKYDL